MAQRTFDRSPLGPLHLHALQQGRCPDCDGVLLLGPCGDQSQHLTCREPACMMDFFVYGNFERGHRTGANRARACFHDPSQPEKECLNEQCQQSFTGPGLYCQWRCAADDA